MNESYSEWYQKWRESLGPMEDDNLFDAMEAIINSGQSTMSMNRKLMEKAIDVSWVEAIENGLGHLDNVVRNPGRDIVDVEEIVPIALSKKITVESVKHLAQHTDYIQSVDPVTGKITPSKILNVHKEETLATYENRFVNTLIDRLYIFVMTRYEKLVEVEHDEEVFTMEFENEMKDSMGGTMKINVSIDTRKSLETTNASGYTVWQRVERLRKTLEGYKGSELCTTLGNNFVRPPIMRTNAIMKNHDLKACLALWQYILGYEKIGYEINIEDTVLKPQEDYVNDLYKALTLNMLLFRTYTADDVPPPSTIDTRSLKAVPPKIVRRYRTELLSGHFDMHADAVAGYVEADGPQAFTVPIPEDSDAIFDQISRAIEIENNFYLDRERKRLEKLAAEEEAERKRKEREARLEEKRRIEEQKREERERIRREKEAEEKRVREMLERRRAEIEAEEAERARLEAERLARIEEERKRAEEEARLAAERAQIEANKKEIRSEFGEAEGVDTEVFDKIKEQRDNVTAYSTVTTKDMEEAAAAIEEQKAAAGTIVLDEETEPEYEDPRTVAARMKLEQQKKEKEQKEKDRALRLRAERKAYEETPFKVIYKRYTYNPIYAIPRFFMWLLFVLFKYIPADTDNPDHKRILAERAARAQQIEHEKSEREKFEVYYKKYATNFPYSWNRFVADQKWKRKKRAEEKKNPKPKPVYNPPKRTAEEQKAIDLQMRNLYREYHVSVIESIRRWLKAHSRAEEERQRKLALGENTANAKQE